MNKPDWIDRHILADLVDANGNVHWEDIANMPSAVDLFPLLTEEEKQQNRWYAEGYGDAIKELSAQPDRGYVEQIKWERDLAIQQLADLGYGLGEKPRMSGDTISRRAAIDTLNDGAELLRRVLDDTDIVGVERAKYEWGLGLIESYISDMKELPSARPTLHGYNIEYLELIARVLQKEDLPPERVVEALTDIGRIVAIVKDEYEEALRKAVKQCMI